MARYVWLECGMPCWSGDVLSDEILERYADAYDSAEDGDGAPTLVDTTTEASFTGDEARAMIATERHTEEP